MSIQCNKYTQSQLVYNGWFKGIFLEKNYRASNLNKTNCIIANAIQDKHFNVYKFEVLDGDTAVISIVRDLSTHKIKWIRSYQDNRWLILMLTDISLDECTGIINEYSTDCTLLTTGNLNHSGLNDLILDIYETCKHSSVKEKGKEFITSQGCDSSLEMILEMKYAVLSNTKS